MSSLRDSLRQAASALAGLPVDSAAFAGLPDEELLEIQAELSQLRRGVDACAAMAAGEVSRRSRRELGYAGLAQRSGFRTPAGLLQHVTGTTSREAERLVRVGEIVQEADARATATASGLSVPPGEFEKPWLSSVGTAVASSQISVEAAEAIRAGLGEPGVGVEPEQLKEAADRLVALAGGTDADQLGRRARAMRDELHEAGIVDRERARREQRSWRRSRRADGMTFYAILSDPESSAFLDGVYDQLTSPRRGGPRFVDEAERLRQESIAQDERTTEQLAFDGLMAVLRIGASVDEKTAARSVLGARRPAVRVLVTREALNARAGQGCFEGQDDPVSIETVERHACDSGTVPVLFDDDGQCVNVGREQRLFTARQRIGLAARDGGCRWPGCDRPPSWTEAHHVNQWHRDHGRTDIADGILLCRYHHLLLHDNHWEIERMGGAYRLVPPRSEDPEQRPRPMPHRSAALAALERERGRRQERQRDTG